MTRLRVALIRSVVLIGSLVMLGPNLFGGELKVSWPSSGAAGYRIYVGDQAGVYGRVLDVGSALHGTIVDLDDERAYHFAVKGYDAKGGLSSSFSSELVCMASPRLESVSAERISAGQTIRVALLGVNFDRGVQVRKKDPRFHVLSIGNEEPNTIHLIVAMDQASAIGAARASQLAPAMFSVINPCRKANEYFDAHPQIADLDGNGRVDDGDLAAVRTSFGSHAGDPGYRPEADLDGDGTVDGADISQVLRRLETIAPPQPSGGMGVISRSGGPEEAPVPAGD